MTRYAKANKEKKRVPTEASTWEELKPKNTMAVKGQNVSPNKDSKGKNVKKAGQQPIAKNDAKKSPKTRFQKKTPAVAAEELDMPALVVDVKKSLSKKNTPKDTRIGCYHCQAPGHKLRDCPKVEKSTVENKMCYKCGSTEHVSYNCKVKNADSYPFATCLICKKTGHIAKQCPSNKKGCYPFGGACLLCGSAEHFKRDCPTGTPKRKAKEIEEGTVAEVIDNNESADAEHVEEPVTPKPKKQKQAKTPVKF